MSVEMATRLAAETNLPKDLIPALAEVCESQGLVNAKRLARSPALLSKVRSVSEVKQRIQDRPELLHTLRENNASEWELEKACERMIFCGRYSAKVGTSLDEALETAAKEFAEAAEVTLTLGGRSQLAMTVAAAVFGDEHLACRRKAYPYVPACCASHGDPVIEARASVDSPLVSKGSLLGYIAMQGSYADDIAVFPRYHGQGVARALLAGADKQVVDSGGKTFTLDVRAANTPAISLYKALGFKFGGNTYPGFLDWDGGFSGAAPAGSTLSKLPPSVTLNL